MQSPVIRFSCIVSLTMVRSTKAICFLVFLITVMLTAFWRPKSRDFLNEIRIGMTEVEVTERLDCIPNAVKRKPYAGSFDPKEFEDASVSVTKIWYKNGQTIQIGFNDQGRVAWKGMGMPPVSRRSHSFLDWIRNILQF